MYARTSFRVQKCAKLEKKGVFLAILTSFGKDNGQTHAKTRI